MAYHLSKTSELLTYATADFFHPPRFADDFESVLGEEVVRCEVCRYPYQPIVCPL
jgi:hypothetical protein